MALTAGSVQMIGIRAAHGLGAGICPSPFTRYGLLDNVDGTQTQYVTGDALIPDTARGTLRTLTAATEPALNTLAGILTPVAPPRAFKAPLTAVATPATALPETFTVPNTNNGQNFSVSEDPIFGCFYYPIMPGNVFACHVCSEVDDGAANPGSDVRADSDVDIWDQYTVMYLRPSGAGADEANYGSLNIRQMILGQTGVGTLGTAHARGIFYANPQRTSIVSGAFSNAPGPVNAVAGAGAGTFNPVMIFQFLPGSFFA